MATPQVSRYVTEALLSVFSSLHNNIYVYLLLDIYRILQIKVMQVYKNLTFIKMNERMLSQGNKQTILFAANWNILRHFYFKISHPHTLQ